MLQTLKLKLNNNLKNIPGWQTDKKIIVFESDDWGSIRMPSKKVFNKLSALNLDLSSGDAERYNRYDSLATSSDLDALFQTLTSVKDVNGNFPKVTAISLVANPDFEKIKEHNFEKYYYEPFTETLKKYPGCDKSYKLWREGIDNKIFLPQFHGREHLNVNAWMNALRLDNNETKNGFEEKMWGFNNKFCTINYQAAFDIESLEEIDNQKKIIADGLKLFENIHGYRAKYFVPPNGPFNNLLEKTAAEYGIKYISASKIQKEPIGNGKTRKVFHYLGQKNNYFQRYITRNCFFEPNQSNVDWVDKCLNDIHFAFKWKKPAVISSHRVNYIGAIDEKNRSNGLSQLEVLLTTILKKWPNTIFMTSEELGELINEMQ